MATLGRLFVLTILAALFLGCAGSPVVTPVGSAAGPVGGTRSASAVSNASAGTTAAASVATSSAPAGAAITPAPSTSYKAGSWAPEWQRWICSARTQMLREDAKAGGHAGEDAATQAIADLKKTTINWEPGADFRAFLGKAAFILLDAAPRPGNAMDDVPPAIKAFEMAYAELKASTGFECPG